MDLLTERDGERDTHTFVYSLRDLPDTFSLRLKECSNTKYLGPPRIPRYRDTAVFGKVQYRVPRSYWKLVPRTALFSDVPRCTAVRSNIPSICFWFRQGCARGAPGRVAPECARYLSTSAITAVIMAVIKVVITYIIKLL